MTTTTDAILMGLRASGKSTVGRLLAQRLDAAFIDLDDLTAERLGCATCAEALASIGEPGFRAAERDALASLLDGGALPASPRVIALGGGTPTAPGVADLLASARAVTVYLRVTPEVLAARLAATDIASRPSLTGRGTIAEVRDLFEQRDPLYCRLARVVIDASEATCASVVDILAARLDLAAEP